MNARISAFPLCLLLLAVSLGAGADPRPRRAAPVIASLDGQFLVATRRLVDPHFSRTVIFMVAHNGEGALGLVVNRALGAIKLKDLFGEIGVEGSDKKVDLHYGGPVEMSMGFVLHTDDFAGTSTQLFRGGIALSTGIDIVRVVASGKGPKQSLFLSGYTGWGAGQLEHEIARGDWLVAPADAGLIFSADPATVWERALARAGLAL